MNIWLIKEGEPLPTDPNPRLMRMGLLAEYLERRGHQVTWIVSTFDHGRKVYRYTKTQKITLSGRYHMVALHSFIAYKRNVSPERIVYNKIMAVQFKRWSRTQTAPDVILCSYPTIELARQAAEYCERHKTVLVLDVRDLWPDIFVRAFPDCMGHLVKAALRLSEFGVRRVFSRADAVIGVSPYFVQWGLKKAGREKKSTDQCFPIAYKAQAAGPEDLQEEFREWERRGVHPYTKNICFFGTFNRKKLDLSTVIQACKRLSETDPEIRLVLCGTGDDLEYYQELAGSCKAILFPGWMNGKQIEALLRMGMLSLYPMKNLIDFKNSIGNKMVEYLSHGLPVLSCSEGYAGRFITDHAAGYLYREGDEEDCRRKIEKCCRDYVAGYEERRAHIRTIFHENFEADRIHRRLEAYLERLAGSRARPAYWIHETSRVGKAAQIGKGTRIWQFCNILDGAQIGDFCSLGQNVFIENGVKIGNRVKIKNNISIYSGVECGDDVFIGPNVVFTNVLNPRSFIEKKHEFKKTILKQGCTLGANATIICGHQIGRYAMVGAGSVVIRDVPDYGLVVGNPSRLAGYVCKCGERLDLSEMECRKCHKTYIRTEQGIEESR